MAPATPRIMMTVRSPIQLVLVTAGFALAGCMSGPSGRPAHSVMIGGQRAVLLDADPCMWNGDSGCTDHSLAGRDDSLCLDRKQSLVLDAGADARRVGASAGERGDHQWIGSAVAKGRIALAVRRTTARRFRSRFLDRSRPICAYCTLTSATATT
jgi:hypothetical protein